MDDKRYNKLCSNMSCNMDFIISQKEYYEEQYINNIYYCPYCWSKLKRAEQWIIIITR